MLTYKSIHPPTTRYPGDGGVRDEERVHDQRGRGVCTAAERRRAAGEVLDQSTCQLAERQLTAVTVTVTANRSLILTVATFI